MKNKIGENITLCRKTLLLLQSLGKYYVLAENCENECRKKNSMPDDQLFSGLRNLRETWR